MTKINAFISKIGSKLEHLYHRWVLMAKEQNTSGWLLCNVSNCENYVDSSVWAQKN